jgi:uncharacterized protein (TIRG00374 family)
LILIDIKTRKKLIYAALFSAGFMYFLLRRIEWDHFDSIAENIELSEILISFLLFAAANVVRTYRFYRMDHIGKKLVQWWNVNNFYNAITATLPGGAGEVATAYALKRFSMFNIYGALRILVLSRLMDVSALTAIFLFSAVSISNGTPYRNSAIVISGTLFLAASVTLIPVVEQYFLKLLQKLPGNNRFVRKICDKLDELHRVSVEQRDINSFSVTFGLSLLIMVITTLYVYILFMAFGVEFSLVQSFYCYGIFRLYPCTVSLESVHRRLGG